MNKDKYLDLGIDSAKIQSYDDYRRVWGKIAPVDIKMVEKNEQCIHKPGDTFMYKTHYEKPNDLCSALAHVLDLYIFRASVGFPSWEDDPDVYKIHCPDKKGTVWEIRRSASPD
ncbi:TIGR04076 family protein [Candidatus Pacearchaeota archaeon]|nr:TIGR04076 family protein [Candidatus Pacearchaeota archaeon]